MPHQVIIEPVLVTQKELWDANVTRIEDLAKKIPAFSTSTTVTANWIPTAAF